MTRWAGKKWPCHPTFMDHYNPPETPTHLLIGSVSLIYYYRTTHPKVRWPYWVKQFIIISCSSWVDWIPPNSFSLGFSHAVAIRLQMGLVPQWLKELGGAQASLCPCTLFIWLSWTSWQDMVIGWFNFLWQLAPSRTSIPGCKTWQASNATISISTSF